MRLIDADKFLERVCTYKDTGCGSCKLQTMCPKDAQTVKAIPIEWIEKKLYCCDNINAEIFVKALIREWEKENDR